MHMRNALDTHTLIYITMLTDGLFTRHRAVAALRRLHSSIQRDQTGECIEGEQQVNPENENGES